MNGYNSMMLDMNIAGTKWWKTDGTDHFIAKDMMMDGSQMIVLTTDGRTIYGDQLNNYIQSDEPINKEMHDAQPQPNPALRAELLKGLDSAELGDVFVGNKTPQQQPEQQPQASSMSYTGPTLTAATETDVETQMIQKVLKPELMEKIHITIDIDEDKSAFTAAIECMMDVLNIGSEKIVDYIYNYIINSDDPQTIKNAVHSLIEER